MLHLCITALNSQILLTVIYHKLYVGTFIVYILLCSLLRNKNASKLVPKNLWYQVLHCLKPLKTILGKNLKNYHTSLPVFKMKFYVFLNCNNIHFIKNLFIYFKLRNSVISGIISTEKRHFIIYNLRTRLQYSKR